jgi:hypothetical protein
MDIFPAHKGFPRDWEEAAVAREKGSTMRSSGRALRLGRMIWSVALLALLAVPVPDAIAAEDGCVSCHGDPSFAVRNKKLFDYFQKWQASTHAANGVTCSDCHGGDASAKDKDQAHGKTLEAGQPGSQVFYKNIPKVCGRCHTEIYDSFTQSKHYQRLTEQGVGPNCVTCHGSLNTTVLTPSKIATVCERCHNDETGNHPDFPERARQIRRHNMMIGSYLKWVGAYFDSIGKPEEMVPFYEQVNHQRIAWHTFNLDQARDTSDAILSRLREKEQEIEKAKLEEKRRAHRESLQGK